MNEAFLRDFFHLPKAEKPQPTPKPKPKVVTIEVNSGDPLDIRAEKIVEFMGWRGGAGGYSIPQLSPAEATLRVLKMLRKYQELDQSMQQQPK